MDALEKEAGAAGDWKTVDRALRRLSGLRAARDYEEGQWLLAARRTAVHAHLGYAGITEYIERVLGYDRRTALERLRVAEALAALPETAAALREGRIVWSAARELTRVATAVTEKAWLSAASGRTARDVAGMVSGRRPGDLPGDTPDPLLDARVIRLELRPEALALYREAIARLRKEVEPWLTEEEALMEMARRVLGGPADEGRSPYQVAVTLCEACGRTWQQGQGEAIEVSSDVGERAECDGQRVPVAGGGAHVGAGAGAGSGRATQTVPPSVRREVVRRDGGRCAVPGCRNSTWLEVHHIVPRSEGGGHDPDLLVLLCGAHHRLQHQGYLWIEGRVSEGLEFLHADGTPYGRVAEPDAVEAGAAAFTGLRRLGVGEVAAKRAIRTARAHVGASAPAHRLMHWALTQTGVTLARPP